MSTIHELRFLFTLIKLTEQERSVILESPEAQPLRDILEETGCDGILSISKEQMVNLFNLLLDNFKSEIDCVLYHLQPVSVELDQYLSKLIDLTMVSSDQPEGMFFRPNAISIEVCRLGNKTFTETSENAFKRFNDQIDMLVQELRDVVSGDVLSVNEDGYLRKLNYYQQILDIVDAFISAAIGAVMGVEEHYSTDFDGGQVLDTIDALTGMEHDDSCPCGCNELNHACQFMQGMEDLNHNKDTKDALYAAGVLMARGYLRVDGMEGPALDKIKDAAKAVIDTLSESLKSMKDAFFNKTDQEIVDLAKTAAETNKKALSALPNNAEAYPKPKQGIVDLAKSVDPDGDMPNIVANMDSPSAGVRIIDALLGYMNKQLTSGSELKKAYDDAQSAVNNLKAVSSKGTSSGEDNKDVNSEIKTQVTEATSNAKQAFADARTTLKKHRKLMNGILKAIRNTTSKNFKTDAKPEEKEETKNE